VDLGQLLPKGDHILDGVRAADDIVALAARQPFAERHGLPAERVTAEQHTGSGLPAQVAEDHHLYGHRAADLMLAAPDEALT
jgi:hypothetical protein